MRKLDRGWRWGIGGLALAGAASGVYFWLRPASLWSGLDQGGSYAPVEIQHPVQGACLPRNLPSPVVLWKPGLGGVGRWAVGIEAGGRRWLFADIEPRWQPPGVAWRQMTGAAGGRPIRLVLAGYESGRRGRLLARASVSFAVAPEAVEWPLFYREVNLPFKEAVKDPSHIRWRFGTVAQGLPPVVLGNLPVCGNCHSFSRNGEFLAMDVDYANDKGSYIITRTGGDMRLATSDIITWDDFRREDGQHTLGLLSQISPDGRYVVSTVKDLSIFLAKPELAFSQLFFPFLGILAVYDRDTKQFASLPGADDPALVQSNPTWSPDGQWIVFARTRAVPVKDVRSPGRILLSGAEGEAFLQQTKEYRYDLYRVPFNGGKGGKAEPLRGASANGRSNYFPKYSPDGRWIVFCQAANYMLLQPDSELFIVPAAGGEAKRLACNLGRMNSWHSWSPDGRWLVFSSKAHSDYTQLYLARITENGEASPPVWLAHLVEPGRAANIPEFVSLPANGIGRIREQFLDDYSYVRAGDEFYRSGDTNRAVAQYRTALGLNPNNVRAHQQLGRLLDGPAAPSEALAHLQAAVRLDPRDPVARFDLGRALTSRGELSNALVHLEAAVRCLPQAGERQHEAVDPRHSLPEALHLNLGIAYQQAGQPSQAEEHYREALRLVPDYPEVHYNFGALLLGLARIAEAESHFNEALRLKPDFGGAYNCLGIIRQRQDRRADAVVCFQKAVAYEPANWRAHLNLAYAWLAEGKRAQAIPELRETLRLKPGYAPAQKALDDALGRTRAGNAVP
jgi:tetratricopeptide (TPR) repeat protein